MTLRGPATERHHPARRGPGTTTPTSDGGGAGRFHQLLEVECRDNDELPALINDVIRAIPARATETFTYLHLDVGGVPGLESLRGTRGALQRRTVDLYATLGY